MSKKILFVDDDEFIKKIYQDRLLAEGFDVDSVSSAEEAKDKFNHNSYDVIVLDYVMTGMSGPEFLKWLRDEKEITTPVIMMSALSQDENIKEAMDLGAAKYLAKDKISPEDLVSSVKEISNGK